MATPALADNLKAALSLQQAGRLDEAKAAFEAIIAQHPQHPEAYHLLGLLLAQGGFPDKGMEILRVAVRLAPANPTYRTNLVTLLQALKRGDEALAQQGELVRITPDAPDANLRLGRMHFAAGHMEKAEAALAQALTLAPDLTPAHLAMGRLLVATGRDEEGEQHLKIALAAAPDDPLGQTLMGGVCLKQGRVNEAVVHYGRARDLTPAEPLAHYNLGNVLLLDRQLAAAKAAYKEAVRLAPNLAEAHAHLGTLMMLEGDLAGGWPEYEWRWKGAGFPNRQAPGPLWDGAALDGGTLLLTTEQGYGDAFQFVRFAAQAAQASRARVVVEAQATIAELMASAPGVDNVVVRGQPLPTFDAQAPLMTLPTILHTTVDTLPAEAPYLSPAPERREHWDRELAALQGRKVGLVWRGNPDQLHNVYRSCPVEALAPLLDVDGVTLVGLQKDPTSAELERLAGLVDFGSRVETFADTAAIMANLDLVISVCTSTAHLAGALGRPTWVMLSAGSDWRWFLGREDCPWYPTARLFRQHSLHDWRNLTTRAASALADWATP